MTTSDRQRRPASPDPEELLSITERGGYLSALRVGLTIVVIVVVSLAPDRMGVSVGRIATVSAVYLAISLLAAAIVRRSGKAFLPVMQGALLLDGLYLAATLALTGGALDAIRLLPYVHVVAVTLLCSYRTGLKLALWHTMLFLLVVESMNADLLPHDGRIHHVTVLTVIGLWVFALGTAASSAASERELRRQKHDLGRLSAMVARIDVAADAHEIPGILLDELCSTFDLGRGVVLASPDGDLQILATLGVESPTELPNGPDPVMRRAWEKRETQLVRAFDPATDALLAALLPGGRNILVVPLLQGGHGLGVVVVERGGSHAGMRRWVVTMVGGFAEHAALALHDAWLTEEREAQLRTIQSLERQLRVHNEELEIKVAERTEELRDVIQRLEETDRQRRRLLAHVVRAAEEERRRISNDIHDDPVQKMVALKMRLELLQKMHPDLPEIEEAHEVIRATITSMRTLLFDLSPPTLDEEGLGSALRFFLEHSSAPFEWSVEDEDLRTEPSSQARLILYRIAQEALANARKHSGAGHVRVVLKEHDGGVSMEIEDDGVGFEPQEALVAAPGHLGLAAMRERAEMAGGWCNLWSLPGAGTTLEVWMPREEAAELDRTREEREASVAAVLPFRADRGAPRSLSDDPRIAR